MLVWLFCSLFFSTIDTKKQKDEAENNDTIDAKDEKEAAREDEGSLLEMTMDWLSLHLEEDHLWRGFRVKKMTKPSLTGPKTGRSLSHNTSIKAVHHESISIMPKLTQAQYEKETKESMIQLRRQNLTTDLI